MLPFTLSFMPARVAIPVPTSTDEDYNQRSLKPYCDALVAVGAEPVIVPLNEPQARVAQLLAGVQGVLLPGSRYDVEPERYGEHPIPECGEADPARTAVDELFLQDSFNLRKPILAICHGTQTLNVWRNGTLVQHLTTPVNHSPGRDIAEAHPVHVAAGSRLAGMIPAGQAQEPRVNSSHHQAVRIPGDRLRVTATSPGDGVIEAVELDDSEHFVVGVQWHPERTFEQSALSRALFDSFVRAVKGWRPPAVGDPNERG
jgi:putative glutamine amidotransferase